MLYSYRIRESRRQLLALNLKTQELKQISIKKPLQIIGACNFGLRLLFDL
jgi:hypothetical protein